MRFGKRSSLAVVIIAVLVLAMMLLPLSGCKKEADVKGKTLRIAFSAAPDAIDVVGYKMVEILQGEGINVSVIYADGGAKAAQALLAGQADISANSLEDIAAIGLKAFALSRPKNVYALVGKPGMTSVADMKGKILGAADSGSIANYIADAIMAKHGLKHDDVSWLQIGGTGARAQALVAGRADVVCVYGGKHIMLTEQGFPTLATMQDDFPGLHDDMWAATPEWLEANSDLAVAIAKAQIEAARWFHDKPDEWLAMALDKVEGLDESTAKATYDMFLKMDMYPVDGLMTPETLDATVKFMVAANVIPDKPWDTYATMQYMDQARKELGITK